MVQPDWKDRISLEELYSFVRDSRVEFFKFLGKDHIQKIPIVPFGMGQAIYNSLSGRRQGSRQGSFLPVSESKSRYSSYDKYNPPKYNPPKYNPPKYNPIKAPSSVIKIPQSESKFPSVPLPSLQEYIRHRSQSLDIHNKRARLNTSFGEEKEEYIP